MVQGSEVIIVLGVATGALLAGKLLRLPPLVSYLVGGVLAGPAAFALVEPSPSLESIAEIGVALLLFGVGIEFSLDQMRRILPRMVASGGAQMPLTVLLTALLFRGLGAAWPVALFAGLLVSLSSTAIVFKLFSETGEIDAPLGKASAGILLFQDLALVPMMLLVPALAHPGEGVWPQLGVALLKAAAVIVLLLVLARAVLPRILELAAKTRVPELFPLAALVAALGTALLAYKLGLSLPIGAFLAGLALSESRFAHQVFAELMPLRDAFVAVFFTTVGMLFDPTMVFAEPGLLVAMLTGVLLKGLLIGSIVALLWRSLPLGILAGAGLAQIGEFSFVLANAGERAGILEPAMAQAFLGCAILSMGATPLLMAAGRRLAQWAGPSVETPRAPEIQDHVVLIGFGLTGRALARVLRETGIAFVVVDMVPDELDEAKRLGVPTIVGDASRRAVLDAAGLGRARAAVITVDQPDVTRRIVSLLRQMNGTLRIIARAQRVDEVAGLERLGADEVIAAEFETSIELLVRLLAGLGIPRHIVRIQESVIRAGHYRALRGAGTTEDFFSEVRRLVAGGVVDTALVGKGSPAAGRTLAELALQQDPGVVVLSVLRQELPLPAPGGMTRLEPGDLVVLFGPHESMDRALDRFDAPREPISGG